MTLRIYKRGGTLSRPLTYILYYSTIEDITWAMAQLGELGSKPSPALVGFRMLLWPGLGSHDPGVRYIVLQGDRVLVLVGRLRGLV